MKEEIDFTKSPLSVRYVPQPEMFESKHMFKTTYRTKRAGKD